MYGGIKLKISKKSVIKISLLFLTVSSALNMSYAGVNKNAYPNTKSNKYAVANNKITYKQAEALVKNYLLSKKIISSQDKKLVIEFDHMDSANRKSYYVIHVYDNMTDHTATIGWYGIDINGDSIYDFLFLKEIAQLKSKPTNTVNNNIKKASPNKITSSQAVNLVKNFLLSKKMISNQDKRLVLQYDHMEATGGKNYYVIHVYDNMKDHTATIGWYGIDTNGNSIYDFIFSKKLR